MMRALKCLAGILVCASAHAQGSAPTVPAPSSTVIYKHVDENGRVTYANSPIKGGARVELDPITVIPSTPSGSLGQVQPPAVPAPTALPVPVAPLPREAQAPATSSLAVPVARVVPMGFRAPNEKIAVKASARESNNEADDTPRPLGTRSPGLAHASANVSVSPAPTWPATDDASAASIDTVAKAAKVPNIEPAVTQSVSSSRATRPMIMTASLSPEAAQKITEQRRAETRKRLLEGELQSEEQLLNHAKLALTEEQRLTPSVRAMRASFAASSEAGVQPPTKEQRETIERHFERVRNLQDQVSMHETHLKGLKEQLAALK